jgi:hypothetical protein
VSVSRTSRSRGVILVLALSACAHVEPAPTTPPFIPPEPGESAPRADAASGDSRVASPTEMQVVEELMAQAEAVRGLRFREPVPVLVQNRNAITAYIESQIEQDELESASIRYTALGLLPPGLPIRELLLRLMGEQVVGYYDPEQARFVIRDDVMRAFERDGPSSTGPAPDEAKMVLIHELVHALQGQHLGLSQAVDVERDTDADNAFRALIEGDATLAMIGAAVPPGTLQALTSDPTQIRLLTELVQSNPTGDPELHDAPPIVRETLLSAYVDGLGFVSHLHGAGGWPLVDAAHREPPTSSEQILHPERYGAGQGPEALRLPDLPALTAAGYALADEDTLGELEMGVYFGLGAERTLARRAADGWGGDRLRIYRHEGGQTAVVWATVWDDEAEAREAEQVALAIQGALAPGRRAQARALRRGRALLLLIDLEPLLQGAVSAALEPLLIKLGSPRSALARR